MDRRLFLARASVLLMAPVVRPWVRTKPYVVTVKGDVAAASLGHTLIHEHILVDFIGAAQYDAGRWNDDEVVSKVLPYLQELRAAGCATLVDCTPNYLGRDVLLLRRLSDASGLNIVTNTGYYGGSNVKFLPEHAFTESANELCARWVKEHTGGIDGTGIKPGFIKISVNDGPLSDLSQKLVRAAGRTHLKTGLTIASHTGPAIPAFEEIGILKEERVAPDAFIWVHAQAENDVSLLTKAARTGAWVSLDGLSDANVEHYTTLLTHMKKEKCLHRTLVSHDAGWYEPGKPQGGDFRGYTALFRLLLPALKENGFTVKEVAQLLETNPAEAFAVRVRRI